MKYNRTATYNYLSNSLFLNIKEAVACLMFRKRPNLLARDDYANAKLRNFFGLATISDLKNSSAKHRSLSKFSKYV